MLIFYQGILGRGKCFGKLSKNSALEGINSVRRERSSELSHSQVTLRGERERASQSNPIKRLSRVAGLSSDTRTDSLSGR